MKLNRIHSQKSRRGVALLEYALLAGGVSLIAAAAVAVFGHKTSDLISAVATILPGAHADDNGPIISGKIIDTTKNGDGAIILDTDSAAAGTNSLTDNTGVDFTDLVLEAE